MRKIWIIMKGNQISINQRLFIEKSCRLIIKPQYKNSIKNSIRCFIDGFIARLLSFATVKNVLVIN